MTELDTALFLLLLKGRIESRDLSKLSWGGLVSHFKSVSILCKFSLPGAKGSPQVILQLLKWKGGGTH